MGERGIQPRQTSAHFIRISRSLLAYFVPPALSSVYGDAVYLALSEIDLMPATAQTSDLMGKLRRGEPGAAEQLVALFYPELRRLAAAKMRRERDPHT